MKFEKAKFENIIKSVLMVIGLVLFVGIICYIVGYLYNPYLAISSFLIGLLSAGIYSLISLIIGPSTILMLVNARPLEEHPRYSEVKNIVNNLCKKVGIPTPKLWYMPSEDINAFATGITPPHAHIVITLGALKHLNSEELAGVLGHEIGHIANYDMLFMTLTSTLVGIISTISHIILYRLYFDEEESLTVLILSILIAIITPIIATIIQLAISREREYLQDAFSAELNGSPWGLISAFEKIKQINSGGIPKSEVLEPLYFVSPDELFLTHPPIEKRIERLKKLYFEP